MNDHGYRELTSIDVLFGWTALGNNHGWQAAIGWDSKLDKPLSIFTTKITAAIIHELKECTKKMVRPVDGYGNHRPEMWLRVECKPVVPTKPGIWWREGMLVRVVDSVYNDGDVFWAPIEGVYPVESPVENDGQWESEVVR